MEPSPTAQPDPAAPGRKGVLGLVFLTVFLDMVGFSIIFPLFPDMLDWYVEREGEGSLVGRLSAWLEGLVDDRFAVIVLFGGLLGSLYSGLQFLFAPVWGAVSDRIGRRPTLLVTLLGTALSYVIWFFAGTFVALVVARLFGGMMAGNISTASAAIADTHSGSSRAKGMGILGAGIGLGFVVGPALGGMASGWDLTGAWGERGVHGRQPLQRRRCGRVRPGAVQPALGRPALSRDARPGDRHWPRAPWAQPVRRDEATGLPRRRAAQRRLLHLLRRLRRDGVHARLPGSRAPRLRPKGERDHVSSSSA